MPSLSGVAPEPVTGAQATASPIESGFAHTLAHDMRTPLTAIQMCAEIIATRDDPQMRVRYATVIAEQAHSMAWALENLVALADELDVGESGAAPVDLMEVARACASDLQGHATARSVEIEVAAWPQTLAVPGCQWAIAQAVRGCAQVLVSLSAANTRLQIRAAVTDGFAELRLSLAPEERGEGGLGSNLAGLDLPWHRLSLLTAGKLIREHGGQVREINSQGERGLSIELPLAR